MAEETVCKDGEIGLRTVEEKDYEFFRNLRMTEGVQEDMGFRYPKSMEEMDETMQSRLESDKNIFFTITYEGERVGQAGAYIELEDGNASFWLFLHPDFHGKGIGTTTTEMMVDYVFRNFPVNRIEANVEEENNASRKMQEKAGFTEEAVRRDYVLRDGEYRDMVCTSILREEWEDYTKKKQDRIR